MPPAYRSPTLSGRRMMLPMQRPFARRSPGRTCGSSRLRHPSSKAAWRFIAPVIRSSANRPRCTPITSASSDPGAVQTCCLAMCCAAIHEEARDHARQLAEGLGYMAQGGTPHVYWHAVRVTKTRFELNDAEHWGGAISLMGVGPATLENVEMWKNRARLGGGGLLGDMDLKASKLVAVDNQVLGGDGGGLYLGNDFEVSD